MLLSVPLITFFWMTVSCMALTPTRLPVTFRRRSRTSHGSLRMDMEEGQLAYSRTAFLAKQQLTITSRIPTGATRQQVAMPPRLNHEVDEAFTSHGMPWSDSIDPTHNAQPFYLDFWQWQVDYMKKHLTNLHALPCRSKTTGHDMTYSENVDQNVRIHTCVFASDEYKRIRLTFLDAGPKTQVFTSLWYPRTNLPVLGVDLLQFNAKKHLCIVDFQPIQAAEELHVLPYEHLLAPIRNQYPTLQGHMTKRFYDETQFFSKQMLLGRHGGSSDESITADEFIQGDLRPAYQAYVKTHVQLAQASASHLHLSSSLTSHPHNNNNNGASAAAHRPPFVVVDDDDDVDKCHAAYDDYSAARDPAHALLAKFFGTTWADDYVYDILFPQSTRPK